ncbi:PQQ-binding-like beta-propeller repeat protein [Halalkalibaculum sp. DA3122]|uniref:outer membrane protein assembly factor BamB family protein n=1 Tax=Halalkalibaculum sp. DA3122 TaxID=3373607 RepID=UPI003754D39B
MKQYLKLIMAAGVLVITGLFSRGCSPEGTMGSGKNWYEYQGGPERNQYSELRQITPRNVDKLEVAWEYHTQDTGQVQTNPVIVNDTLYGMTATVQPFALNAATGQEYWRKRGEGPPRLNSSRGLVYWEEGNDKRILYTHGEWLYALDAATGNAIPAFGDSGRVSLKAGLEREAQDKMVMSTTPGTVYRDLVVMPLRVSEGPGAAKGHIQAFNIKTGELEWIFHTIPKPGEFGYETWPKNAYENPAIGGANNWAGMAVDRRRGIVYVPTGSASYDFYGGNRKGKNLFANSLLALDAETGERIWHYQFVHHDILDRDLPAPPNLLTVTRGGKEIDAVAQTTKQGFVFLFDRETGEPLFPIEERPVPESYVGGEHTWPTQPFPTRPAPYARQTLTPDDISPYAENREELRETVRNSRFEGPFTPLSAQGTIVFPGLDGGAEWGGAAADPQGILYVNSNQMAWHIRISPAIPEEELQKMSPGKRLYTTNCTTCHGPDRSGNPASGFPALTGLDNTRSKEYVENIITGGKGMMPAFGSQLSDPETEALIAYLFNEEQLSNSSGEPVPDQPDTARPEVPYQISGYTRFVDSNGYPAISPPWGTLNAIDLNSGEYLWKVTLGDHTGLRDEGDPKTGTQNYGGPVVTASGLLFIAGTSDGKFRAFDKETGELLWETTLPAAAFATPSTYEVDGKQYIVVACGGTKLGTPGGDSYVAFALPE